MGKYEPAALSVLLTPSGDPLDVLDRVQSRHDCNTPILRSVPARFPRKLCAGAATWEEQKRESQSGRQQGRSSAKGPGSQSSEVRASQIQHRSSGVVDGGNPPIS